MAECESLLSETSTHVNASTKTSKNTSEHNSKQIIRKNVFFPVPAFHLKALV